MKVIDYLLSGSPRVYKNSCFCNFNDRIFDALEIESSLNKIESKPYLIFELNAVKYAKCKQTEDCWFKISMQTFIIGFSIRRSILHYKITYYGFARNILPKELLSSLNSIIKIKGRVSGHPTREIQREILIERS